MDIGKSQISQTRIICLTMCINVLQDNHALGRVRSRCSLITLFVIEELRLMSFLFLKLIKFD